MSKIVPLTPEQLSRHHTELQIWLMTHATALKAVCGALASGRVDLAVRELNHTTKSLHTLMLRHAKARGYRPPAKKKRRAKR